MSNVYYNDVLQYNSCMSILGRPSRPCVMLEGWRRFWTGSCGCGCINFSVGSALCKGIHGHLHSYGLPLSSYCHGNFSLIPRGSVRFLGALYCVAISSKGPMTGSLSQCRGLRGPAGSAATMRSEVLSEPVSAWMAAKRKVFGGFITAA